MLVLSRRQGEQIKISDSITLTIVSVRGQNVRLGVDAPMTVSVVREELLPRNGSPSNTIGRSTGNPK